MEKIRYLKKQNFLTSKITRKGTRFKKKIFFLKFMTEDHSIILKTRDSRFINEVNALEILNKKNVSFPKVFLNKKKNFKI